MARRPRLSIGNPAHQFNVGPSIQVRLTDRMHLDMNCMFGTNEDSDRQIAFLILGYDFGGPTGHAERTYTPFTGRQNYPAGQAMSRSAVVTSLAIPGIATNAVAPPAPTRAPVAPESSVRKRKPSLPEGGKTSSRPIARVSGVSDHQQGSEEAGSGNGAGNSGYVPPRLLLRSKPPYPDEARAQHFEATVMILVSVDKSGRVTDTHLVRSRGHVMLDRATLTAVRSWRFDPARQNGAPIAARVEVPVRFRFEERSVTKS